jgi:DNA helicase-2/ATP-dependent DNA helicase PcrA
MAVSPASSTADPPWLAGLNAPQREAVTTLDGPVLILAGAGTGKTRALTARLAQILWTRRAWPSEVLAVTFTNKAAREMKHRMALLLGADHPLGQEGLPWLGTFHAMAARMLRRHAGLVGLEPGFTILDTDDQLRLLKQTIAEANIDEKRWPAKSLAALIDRWKNRGQTPEAVPPGESHGYADGKGAALYARYQQRLAALNTADFGDLLLHMLTNFQKHPDVLADYQRRFKYVLVDEYQDTNVAQYQWLKALAGTRHNIACVGDDDQSIYSWRGAEVANILRFEQDFPGATMIRLEQNYRSQPHILSAANALIAHNTGRLGKTLHTEQGLGEPVHILGVWDGPEEARQIGDKVEQLARGGASLNDMAILVRAQHQTQAFESRFIAIGMPYKIIGGFRFYERAVIRDAIAYLRLVASPNDGLAFERIINTPRRGLGDKAMASLHHMARQMDRPLTEAAAALVETDALSPAARRGLKGLLLDLARWREAAADTPHAELARIVLEESGYIAMLQADKSPDAAGRLENLKELPGAMEDYPSLVSFLEHVSLVMENEASDAAEKLTIMTLHAAKGLEFDHVFLPGWEEGLFPSQRALDEGGNAALEEERRLAYVGITRARHTAHIFHAANRQIYGQWTASIPSRFIEELPEAHVEARSSLSGGASLWRAALGAHDPFADVMGAARQAGRDPERYQGRGPGWGRAMHTAPAGAARGRGPLLEARAVVVMTTIPAGARVRHGKFGDGTVISTEDAKLEIGFDSGDTRRVMASFVSVIDGAAAQ